MTVTENASDPAEEKTSFRQLLSIRNFRLLWQGQILSDFGNSMTNLALLLMINRLTGSATAMATMSIVLMLPRLLFGFIAGVFVDRFDRQKLMVYAYLLRGALVLSFLLVKSADLIWLFYLIGFLQGIVSAFFDPANAALLPNLVPTKSLLTANSFSVTSMYVFMMLGNSAAGVLVGLIDGFWLAFSINSALYFLSALMISRIRYAPPVSGPKRSLTLSAFTKQIGEGLKISFGNRLLAGTIAAISLTMLGVGATNVLNVPLMINVLKVPETYMGLTGISETTAMIISGSLIAGMAARLNPIKMSPLTLIGFGVSMMLVSAAQNLWQILAIFFITGLFIPGINSFTQTILQIVVPDSLRGRVTAARMVVVMIANLASMGAAGILADKIGIQNVFIISGGFAVLGGLAAMLIFRGAKLEPLKAEDDGIESKATRQA
jgi:DHA3 family macrolide efflux protein-like MFS transporter